MWNKDLIRAKKLALLNLIFKNRKSLVLIVKKVNSLYTIV